MKRFIFSFTLVFLLCGFAYAESDGFSVSSGSSMYPLWQNFSNSSPMHWAKVISSDPSINRMTIAGYDGKIYFDKKPSVGDSFFIPHGAFNAAAWGYGGRINDAVKCVYCEQPAPKETTKEIEENISPATSSSQTNVNIYCLPGSLPYYYNEPKPYLPPTNWSSHKVYGTIGTIPGVNTGVNCQRGSK